MHPLPNKLAPQAVMLTALLSYAAASQAQGATADFDANILRFFKEMSGKMVCQEGPDISPAEVRHKLDEYFRVTGKAGNIAGPDVIVALATLYPCPFPPFRPELRVATARDITGTWLFPESSIALRDPPKLPTEFSQGVMKLRCEGLGFMADGTHVSKSTVSNQSNCDVKGAAVLEDLKASRPKVSSWAMVDAGRLLINRTDQMNYVEKWDVYAVEKPFSFQGVDFNPGDLVGYLRQLNSSDIYNNARMFRHLVPLK